MEGFGSVRIERGCKKLHSMVIGLAFKDNIKWKRNTQWIIPISEQSVNHQWNHTEITAKLTCASTEITAKLGSGDVVNEVVDGYNIGSLSNW